jgi:hypothetical protein
MQSRTTGVDRGFFNTVFYHTRDVDRGPLNYHWRSQRWEIAAANRRSCACHARLSLRFALVSIRHLQSCPPTTPCAWSYRRDAPSRLCSYDPCATTGCCCVPASFPAKGIIPKEWNSTNLGAIFILFYFIVTQVFFYV